MATSVAPNFDSVAPVFDSAPAFDSFTLTLVQLCLMGSDKAANLQHANEMVLKVAKSGSGTKPKSSSSCRFDQFPIYAENIGPYTPDKEFDVQASSIPERDEEANKVYSTCTVYSPTGALVALHRKVRLFDIDIPGKIMFKESKTLAGGSTTNYFDTEFACIGLGICYDIRFPEMAMTAARQGSRAVDNQIFFSMCSPARDMTAEYHAVMGACRILWSLTHSKTSHLMFLARCNGNSSGKVIVEADESEMIVHANIDPKTFDSAKAGIPITKQRRFDVYVDVGETCK
ncbi:hypothetical protein AZE42_01518 [Rhizopogon vesiculosus]|uniref:CN hydrolase domain-containing protein n=1 Tax=Rhizopogon vesiculosus TaxID=180088 RepID=A0A1J8R1Q5_9AGAM|nr:hypothetical protein AZE42_01518 [Rhizopogon vesiculosus]